MQASSKPDIDSTLSNLVNNMEIAGKNPAWMHAPPATTAAPSSSNPWAQPPQQQQQQQPFYGLFYFIL